MSSSTPEPPHGDRSPVPQPDEETAPFWAALADERLLLRSCEVCGSLDHPDAVVCWRCDSPQLVWSEQPLRGTLFSWAIEGRTVIEGMEPPYVVAQLTPTGCDEGTVRLVGTLLTEAPEELRIGMPLTIGRVVVPGSDLSILVFEPA